MSIADEVLAALNEAGSEVGGAPLIATFNRPTPNATPWDAAGPSNSFELTAIDEGVKEMYVSGTSATRKARMLMVDALGPAPIVGDRVTVAGSTHDVLMVMTEAPAGVPLYHRVEIST